MMLISTRFFNRFIAKAALKEVLGIVKYNGSSPLRNVSPVKDGADKENVDLIVFGTRGRTGFAKKLLGSVALGVVTHASCPVTVVK